MVVVLDKVEFYRKGEILAPSTESVANIGHRDTWAHINTKNQLGL
jgi:hypothetical protein